MGESISEVKSNYEDLANEELNLRKYGRVCLIFLNRKE